jgi:hypothetical protein
MDLEFCRDSARTIKRAFSIQPIGCSNALDVIYRADLIGGT